MCLLVPCSLNGQSLIDTCELTLWWFLIVRFAGHCSLMPAPMPMVQQGTFARTTTSLSDVQEPCCSYQEHYTTQVRVDGSSCGYKVSSVRHIFHGFSMPCTTLRYTLLDGQSNHTVLEI